MAKKIILVEDDSAITEIYQTVMKKAHFDFEVFDSGQEVIKMIKDVQAGQIPKPDIFLLDLILPDMNGMEILRELKKDSVTKDIKVFILSNQEFSESQKPDDIKPDKFIIKAHIRPTELLEVIKKELE